VHRDLKAANVLVGSAGVKLADFGIAKLIEPGARDAEQLTTVGRQVGTPIAMSPEQLRGEPVDARTDVYGLGVLTFYLLTRRYPFDFEDPTELEAAHLSAAPPRPSRFATVPRTVDAVVLRCLEKRPEARFQSVTAVIEELRRAIAPSTDRTQAPALRTPAVAVLVEARLPAGELDDDAADELAEGLELAADRLGRAGLRTMIETGTSIVAASAAPSGHELEMRGRAAALAGEIVSALRSRAEPRLGWVACAHADAADVGADGQVAGGPLLRLADWAPPPNATGALATAECVDVRGQRHVLLPLKFSG